MRVLTRPFMSVRFDTTRWTLVLQAADSQSAEGRRSLDLLCRDYWQPVYAFVRSQGTSHEDAQDLTQKFFQTLLQHKLHARVSPERGRFRTWLLAVLKNVMHEEHRRLSARKRGAGQIQVGVEEIDREHIDPRSPDRDYERQWAQSVLGNAVARLRDDYTAQGHEQRFAVLQPLLFDATKGAGADETHATALGISLNAAKIALTRLRARFRDILRLEVARLVDDPADVDDEIRTLMAALQT